MAIDKTLIDQLLADYKKPEDIIGENGLLKQLTKAILERALQAELTDHLGFEKHDPAGHRFGVVVGFGVVLGFGDGLQGKGCPLPLHVHVEEKLRLHYADLPGLVMRSGHRTVK